MDAFSLRRRAFLDAVGPAVAVFPGAPVFLRNNDVEHEYRQDSDLYYLTGFEEPECVAVLSSDGASHRLVLFVRPRDPERETWDGARAGVEGARERFGADEAYPIGELSQRLPELLQKRRLCYRLGKDRPFDDRLLAAVERARQRGRRGTEHPTEILDPGTVVHEMRLVKSGAEIDRMRQAAAITGEGHVRAMAFARPGAWEYEVEAELRQAFRRRGAERMAYQPIVGAGPNATVLHYRANRARLEPGQLLLIDAGCEYGYYASDVTRTFPVSGAFTPPQRALYEVVLEAQAAGIARAVPGETLEGVHAASVGVLVEGLLRLGLLEGDPAEIIARAAYRRFYMHRTSHFLGMDVHDVGAAFVDGAPRALSAGMVITVEPGLYVSARDQAAPEAYRGLGIRIEDDVLIAESGPHVLTDAIPRSVADVEAACAR